MSELVQVALAEDVTEAEQIQAALVDAGVAAQIAADDEADAYKVLVPEDAVETAQDVLELAPMRDDESAEL
jgi:type III secretory pathway lipoprotein EscJ